MLWTRDRVLAIMGWSWNEDPRLALKRIRQAASARTPKVTRIRGETVEITGGEPDHAIRLDAAKQLCRLAGVQREPEYDDRADPGRPIAVNVILQLESRPALQAGGLEIHLARDGNGDR